MSRPARRRTSGVSAGLGAGVATPRHRATRWRGPSAARRRSLRALEIVGVRMPRGEPPARSHVRVEHVISAACERTDLGPAGLDERRPGAVQSCAAIRSMEAESEDRVPVKTAQSADRVGRRHGRPVVVHREPDADDLVRREVLGRAGAQVVELTSDTCAPQTLGDGLGDALRRAPRDQYRIIADMARALPWPPRTDTPA